VIPRTDMTEKETKTKASVISFSSVEKLTVRIGLDDISLK
jgi:hypothetical protein